MGNVFSRRFAKLLEVRLILHEYDGEARLI